jgi:hypothetical protein
MWSVAEGIAFVACGWGGGRENDVVEPSVSSLRMRSREAGSNHGGGTIFARRWRLRRRASHNGRGAR